MKKFLQKSFGYGAFLLTLPLISLAQTTEGGLFGVMGTFEMLLSRVLPILVGFAVIYFLFGVLQYIIAKDPEAQKTARLVMMNGIIVLFVMVSVWGLVNLLGKTFGVGAGLQIVPKELMNTR